MALAEGWEQARARTLYDSIGMHLNPLISATEHPAEVRFLGAGAYLDVAGLQHERLPAEAKAEILRRHPRAGFADDILGTMDRIRHPPDTRSGFMSHLKIDFLVRHNPLDRRD